jgi:hypothetical protein
MWMLVAVAIPASQAQSLRSKHIHISRAAAKLYPAQLILLVLMCQVAAVATRASQAP